MKKAYFKIKFKDEGVWKDLLGFETQDDSEVSLLEIKKNYNQARKILSDVKIFRTIEEPVEVEPVNLGENPWPTGKP